MPNTLTDPVIVRTVNFGLSWVAVTSSDVAAIILSDTANVWVSLAARGVGGTD